MKNKIEIFSADCPICRETIKMVENSENCKNSDISIHKCEGNECCTPAKNYKIRTLPSIVVNGKIVIEGKPSQKEIESLV